MCKCSVLVNGLITQDTSDGIVEGIEGGGGSHSVSEHMVNVVVFELEDSVREPDLRGQHLHVAAEQGANPR